MAAATAGSAPDGVVSAAWLKERLGKPGIKVLDASWYMPVQARDGLAEFKAKRIPGARFFNVDKVSDPGTDLPHMLPTAPAFSAALTELGVTKDDTVVVYDGMGIFSAPRAWWTFKVFGHDSVFVLEGGLPAWEAEGGELDTSPADEAALHAPATKARAVQQRGDVIVPAAGYPAKLDEAKVRNWQQMLANIELPSGSKEQVVDARSPGRFVGTEPEPRAGLKGGHIPGARNVPFPAVLQPGGRLKPSDELKTVFEQAGVKLGEPLVGSCGSGLTACILALAAYRATGGAQLLALYDGSWSEWGGREGLPISTDAP